jgi:hypothetical protein
MAASVKLSCIVETGEPFTIAWSKVSGPGTVTFSHSTSLTTEAQMSLAGVYVIRATVTTANFTKTDDVTITATANAAPVVSAGEDFSVLQNTNANLIGSYTEDGFPGIQFWYRFDSNVIGGMATAGTFNLNHATQSSATSIRFANFDRFGVNRQSDLLTIAAGSTITLVDEATPSRKLSFVCGAPSAASGQVVMSMSAVTVSVAQPLRDDFAVNFTPTKAPIATWSMQSGTGMATFGDVHALKTTVSFSNVGTKTLRLTVTDGVLAGFDEVTVNVHSVLGTDFVRATSQAVPGGVGYNSAVFMVDMSRFPVGWWNAAAAASDTTGRTVRVCLAGTTTQVPFDIINFNGTTKAGFMTIGANAAAGGTGFDVYVGNSALQMYAATDTYGRYNVYRTALKGFWPNGGGFDRTRNINSLVNVGSPSVGAGPIGSLATTYSATARATLLLPAVVSSPISFFAASDTTSPNSNSWYHTIGISRTKAGTLDSYNNAVYMTAAGSPLLATVASMNGSGVWQGSSAQCTAQTWKGQGGIHTSNTSRTAVTAQATSATSTVNNVVTELDHLCIGHFPKLLGGPGIIANPKVSLCFFWNEAVTPQELKYLDLMLTQGTFWPTWTLNP